MVSTSIRDCGSTVPEFVCAKVLEHGAHLGIALDGDADRVIIADENGEVVDGDQILALIAASWHQAGMLRGGGIVATVMSNLGLERHLAGLGLELHRTKVGDRYVAEHMRASGLNVGGEQSGHLILSDFATTGDGLLAALQVLAVLVNTTGRPLRGAAGVPALPQRLKNVRFTGASPLREERVQAAIRGSRGRMNGAGRVLIRESGTEPLVRVMAEREDSGVVAEVVDSLCETIAEVARVREAASFDARARTGHRRFGLRRWRRHSGRHQDDHRAGCLRRNRDHRTDRAEHAWRAWRHGRAARLYPPADRRGHERYRRRRHQDRHAGRHRRR